jgi:hypothetical protein
VNDNRELWPDRSTDEHPVWSKTCSIHPDIGRKKKPSENSTIFPTISTTLGLKWEVGMEQAQKRPKVFGWAQIISLLIIEQSRIWLAQT